MPITKAKYHVQCGGCPKTLVLRVGREDADKTLVAECPSCKTKNRKKGPSLLEIEAAIELENLQVMAAKLGGKVSEGFKSLADFIKDGFADE